MSHLHRAVIAVVVALGFLLAGTAIAEPVDEVPPPATIPYDTQEACEANGGVWVYTMCVEPAEFQRWVDEMNAAQAPAESAPTTAPAQSGTAAQSQPQYTG